MIGLAMHATGLGGNGPMGLILGGLVAGCLVFGLCKLANCRMRDCGCIKRFLRMTGTDPFDSFECLVIAHDTKFSRGEKPMVTIRVTAGDETVQTDENTTGIFQ